MPLHRSAALSPVIRRRLPALGGSSLFIQLVAWEGILFLGFESNSRESRRLRKYPARMEERAYSSARSKEIPPSRRTRNVCRPISIPGKRTEPRASVSATPRIFPPRDSSI